MPPGGRLQIGTVAGFKSERVAGFNLECMAGFVGIRKFDAQTTFAMEPDGVHCTISLAASEHRVTDHPGIA